MKLASFQINERTSYGVVKGNEITDIGSLLNGKYPSLKDFIASGEVSSLVSGVQDAPVYDTDSVKWLPVIPNPGKILCVGLNYQKHIAETGRETPKYPTLFTRFPNAQVGHGEPLICPSVSDSFDFEGELAVIIGKAGRNISANDAFEYVAGYSVFNDGSVRDWQKHTLQFTAGKNFVASGSFGPYLVTKDEISDVNDLTLETRLNGQVVQHEGIDDLLFKIPELIEYISTFTELEPGDVIATGTPGGCGAFRSPPLWLKPGDVVEVEIPSIGLLRNEIISDK